MKKKGIFVCLFLLAVLAGAAALGIGGTASDPLVSLDYLENTYLPSLMAQVEAQAEGSAAASYEDAAARVDALDGNGSGGESTLLAKACSRGDTVTMKEGSVLTVAAGSLLAETASGVLVDVTEGTAGTKILLLSGHRYIAAEGARATLTVRSDAANLILEGAYTYRSVGKKATPFTDLAHTEWYYGYVQNAYEKGLMNGVSGSLFAPQSPVTRAMMATILYRIAGEPSASPVPPFSDIPAGLWYSKPVTWASDSHIVKGIGDGLYAPDSSVTREQVAAMLANYTASWLVEDVTARGDLTVFSDGSAVSLWARDAVSWAVGAGILNGREDGRLDPGGSASRAELCAMLQRYLAVYKT